MASARNCDEVGEVPPSRRETYNSTPGDTRIRFTGSIAGPSARGPSAWGPSNWGAASERSGWLHLGPWIVLLALAPAIAAMCRPALLGCSTLVGLYALLHARRMTETPAPVLRPFL